MPVLFWVSVLGAIISAALNWYAVIKRIQVLEYIFKPSVMVCLLLVLWSAPVQLDGRLALWGTIALVFSLIGDVLLMLPNRVFFSPGLLAFLLAHVAYIIGFNVLEASAYAWLIWIPIAVLGILFLRPMLKHIRDSEESVMRIPVGLYGLILSTMLFSSWSTLFQPTWTVGASTLAPVGGAFFFTSDLLLGWDRFVDTQRIFQVAVIITYHAAQMCLVAAICVYAL